ncbi:GNAT family N-acetyltransferase [Hyphomonas jannaschiana]|uniref:GNAT family N-acetyltransferase n=1 Tax=Hyphomonas jannaschiana TaxID=86 RepID=UPI0009DEA8AE|nr:N-acetyltransferase [Hyphomonas jannaschiana]
MTAVRIRPATETDIPALVALEQSFPEEDRFPARTWRRLLRGQSMAYVAVSDGEICGAAVYLYRTGTKVARLYSLTVAPSHRGKGIASALLAAGETDAQTRGCDRVRLEVRRSNATAIRLYERHDFRVMAQIPSYYPDGETAARMEKPIQP